jgi:MoaA/NifB/PqqE/SkfB family radical SAM enzyme
MALLPFIQQIKTIPFFQSLRLILFIFSGFRCFPPSLVDLELTNRCDLHCTMCWFHGECGIGDNYHGVELSTDEVGTLIDQVSKHKPQIYLGGAEPFLRDDLFIILEYIKRLDLVVSFATNGTLFDQRKIEMLVTLGIDQVAFSIDGDEKNS